MSSLRGRPRAASNGFSLLELLAAMAIGSVVLAAVAGLIRNVGLSFEAGTRNVGYAERLMLAVERLAADFSSARYVQKSGPEGPLAVFIGGPRKVAFVSGAGVTAGGPAQEIVLLEVEEGGELTRLVRRRAPWLGHRTPLADVKPRDAVTLLEGRFRVAFSYAGGDLVWKNGWADRADLPRYVRLDLRDRQTNAPLFGALDLEIRADAPASCSKPGAMLDCASSPPAAKAGQPAPPRRSEPR